MKKEAIFAIIMGVIVGLGITFGIYKLKKSSATSTEDQLKKIDQQATPTPSADANQKLLITSPKDESILTSTTLRVSGSAEPNEMIVVFINDKEYITQADSIGAFAQDVELDAGGNILQFTAIASDGKQTSVTQNVVVSSVSLDEAVEAAPEDQASSSAKATPTKKPIATPKATATPKENQ
ncbi:MAG: hypothetical protein ABI425_04635 [Patescibacteria group bacterium]